jgi:Arc/MetJ-type ribon-helix-helix transcriptional regulator
VHAADGNAKTMPYELPADIGQQLQEQMATGRYATWADVLRDALAALRRQDREIAAIRVGVEDM